MRRFTRTPYYTGPDAPERGQVRGTLELGETVVIETPGGHDQDVKIEGELKPGMVFDIGTPRYSRPGGPFLIDMGYDATHRGIVLATVTVVATIVGTFAGGFVTTMAGLGHALWIFGVLQIFSNAGYLLLAMLDEPNLVAMYGATGFELFCSGLGMGAFGVLLLRLTEKRFSATQYALLSSLFALPRVVAGPATGFAVNAFGWPTFFVATMVIGIPGLLMLARFVPPGVREPDLDMGDRPLAAEA